MLSCFCLTYQKCPHLRSPIKILNVHGTACVLYNSPISSLHIIALITQNTNMLYIHLRALAVNALCYERMWWLSTFYIVTVIIWLHTHTHTCTHTFCLSVAGSYKWWLWGSLDMQVMNLTSSGQTLHLPYCYTKTDDVTIANKRCCWLEYSQGGHCSAVSWHLTTTSKLCHLLPAVVVSYSVCGLPEPWVFLWRDWSGLILEANRCAFKIKNVIFRVVFQFLWVFWLP